MQWWGKRLIVMLEGLFTQMCLCIFVGPLFKAFLQGFSPVNSFNLLKFVPAFELDVDNFCRNSCISPNYFYILIGITDSEPWTRALPEKITT